MPAAFGEIRPCDGSKSKYTPNAATGEGKGEGTTLPEAQQAALFDALDKAAKAQFDCEECPDGNPCGKIGGSANSAGAVMQDPRLDCDWDDDRDVWVCEGTVVFQVAGAPKPWSEAGCAPCADASPRP